MGVLGRVPDRKQVLARLIVGHQSPGLHGRRGQTLDLVLLPDHVIRLGKCCFQVAPGVTYPHRHVGIHLLVNDEGILAGGLKRVNDGRQRLIVHLDQVQGLPCLTQIVGYNHGHGLPHVAHLVFGKDRVLRGPVVVAFLFPAGGRIADGAFNIRRGDHHRYAGEA